MSEIEPGAAAVPATPKLFGMTGSNPFPPMAKAPVVLTSVDNSGDNLDRDWAAAAPVNEVVPDNVEPAEEPEDPEDLAIEAEQEETGEYPEPESDLALQDAGDQPGQPEELPEVPGATKEGIPGESTPEDANRDADLIPATTTNLDQLTAEELKKLEEAAHLKLLEKQAEERRDVVAQIVEVVKTYNISMEEVIQALGGLKAKRKGVKAKIKFRDPETGQTWSGRGKEPMWMQGRDREQFRLKTPEASA